MASRLDLQIELEELLGTRNVYFQPPESIRMKYPAIRYQLDGFEHVYADDIYYKGYRRYSITYLDANPDNDMIEKFLTHFKMIQFDRHYASDGLNHYLYTLYY